MAFPIELSILAMALSLIYQLENRIHLKFLVFLLLEIKLQIWKVFPKKSAILVNFFNFSNLSLQKMEFSGREVLILLKNGLLFYDFELF